MDRKNDGLRLMDGAGYKKIIIACDSYKGCLSSREVNEAIASGVKEWNADDASPEIITLEMSDGGEGMLDAFLSATKILPLSVLFSFLFLTSVLHYLMPADMHR